MSIDRHKAFQFGTNPMEMSPFEKSRAALEKKERKDHHDDYVRGLQGRDGGDFKESEVYPLS
jgi:hypothetical protein